MFAATSVAVRADPSEQVTPSRSVKDASVAVPSQLWARPATSEPSASTFTSESYKNCCSWWVTPVVAYAGSSAPGSALIAMVNVPPSMSACSLSGLSDVQAARLTTIAVATAIVIGILMIPPLCLLLLKCGGAGQSTLSNDAQRTLGWARPAKWTPSVP